MHYKKFLSLTLLLFTSLITGYFYLVDKYVIIDRPIPFSYRQFLLESSANIEGKVIIVSGSNSIHSIDPFVFYNYFKAPVITNANNAGYPLKPKIFDLLSVAKTNDIIILPLEWNQYTYGDILPKVFLERLANDQLMLEYNYNNLPLWEKIKFIYTQYPLDYAIDGMLIERMKWSELVFEDFQRLSLYRDLLEKNINETYGNTSRNGPESEITNGNYKSCDQYILGEQIAKGFEISQVFKSNLDKLLLLKDKGIKVYFTWPTVVDSESSRCYQSELAQKELPIFAKKIKTLVENNGFEFIGEYQESHFSKKCFLNTHYHIKNDCAKERTSKLVKAIKNKNIPAINSINNLEQFTLQMKKKVQASVINIGSLLIDNFPKVGKEIISAGEFSRKILFIDGWYKQEKWGIWSQGEQSKLDFKLNENLMAQETIKMSINGVYYNGREKTEVVINGKLIGSYDLTDIVIEFPTHILSDNHVKIIFRHYNVKSPYDLKRGKDKRKIKFGLKQLSFN